MKLRTVILARHDGKYVLCVDKDAELGPDEVAGEKEVIHDATAANALMEAIAAWGKHPGYQGGESWVKKRADEIMAQWGFDSGEDA